MRRKSRSRIALPVDAALSWSTLGLRWMEMMAASGQVIAHRTSRHNTPVQWMSMGTEKMLAGLASSSAMAREMVEFPIHDAMAIPDAWARLLLSGMAPYRAKALRNARSHRRRLG
jgi:hypothetical protein